MLWIWGIIKSCVYKISEIKIRYTFFTNNIIVLLFVNRNSKSNRLTKKILSSIESMKIN